MGRLCDCDCLYHLFPEGSVLLEAIGLVGEDAGAVAGGGGGGGGGEGGGGQGGEQGGEEEEEGCGAHHDLSPSVKTPTGAQLLYYFARQALSNLFMV